VSTVPGEHSLEVKEPGCKAVHLHCGILDILGNEEADKLARQALAKPLLGPEPALGMPKCSAREAIKNWNENQHYSAWRDLPGHRYDKLFIGIPCKKELMTCLG
jgi:hypothetical protein